MTPKSTPSTGAHQLSTVVTLVHEPYSNDAGIQTVPCFSYLPDGEQMIGGYGDKTVRLWDLRTGKEIEEARIVCKNPVSVVAVSKDGRWVIAALDNSWELKAWEMKTGIVKTFEGHSQPIFSIDISTDSKLLANGSGETAQVWSLDTGDLVAGPFKVGWVGGYLQVWDIHAQKLDIKVGEHGDLIWDLPVFWTTQDRTIVAAFSFSGNEVVDTIYEFDASTLKTVGASFKGHTHWIRDLALSSDCALLVSASADDSIKLWAFDSRHLLASFDVQFPVFITLSPDAHQITRTNFHPRHIYICDIPPDILADIWPSQHPNARKHAHTADLLNSRAPTRPTAPRRHPMTSPFVIPPAGHSPTIHEPQSSFRQAIHLRRFLPSPFRRVTVPSAHTHDNRDPLDCTATSPRLPRHSFPMPATTVGHHNVVNHIMPTPALPISQQSTSASSTIKSYLNHISHWLQIRTDRGLRPIVDVPLAHGQKRHAAAHTATDDDGCVRDEESDSRSPSPNSSVQQASAPAQTITGEHGRSCLCFRL